MYISFFLLSSTRLLLALTIQITRQEPGTDCVPFASIWTRSRFVYGTRVANCFSFLRGRFDLSCLSSFCVLCVQCCLCLDCSFLIALLCLMCPMLPVSGLFILDCPSVSYVSNVACLWIVHS